MKHKKIYIFGASASGVSTLGTNLSSSLGIDCFDSDCYFWKDSNPPFQEVREINERDLMLKSAIGSRDKWIISGTLLTWGMDLQKEFDLAIYLYASPEERIRRANERAISNFSNRVLAGGDMYEHHQNFLRWIAQYEEGNMGGRSKVKHEEWINQANCPVARIDANQTSKNVLNSALNIID